MAIPFGAPVMKLPIGETTLFVVSACINWVGVMPPAKEPPSEDPRWTPMRTPITAPTATVMTNAIDSLMVIDF